MSYKSEKTDYEHRRWERSVEWFHSRLDVWYRYIDDSKHDSNYAKLIEMIERSIFREVDNFPVHLKSLPDALKEKYKNSLDAMKI